MLHSSGGFVKIKKDFLSGRIENEVLFSVVGEILVKAFSDGSLVGVGHILSLRQKS